MEISSNSGFITASAGGGHAPFWAENIPAIVATAFGDHSNAVLLDTNILVYAYNADSEYYSACRPLLNRAINGDIDACFAPQILFEFFAVVTNPARVSNPIAPAEALDEIEKIVDSLPHITPPIDLHERVVTLMRHLGFGSKHIYDVVLAATMLGNGISRIYTYDADRFQKIPGISVLNP